MFQNVFLKFYFLALLVTALACSTTSTRAQQDALLHMQIGTGEMEAGRYPQALTELTTANELDPNNPTVENNLALVYFMREKYDLAEKHLQSALKLNPRYTEALNNLARVHIEVAKYDLAIRELERVVADLTYTGADKAWVNMGLAYFRKGDFQSAKEKLGQAIHLNRSHCLAHTLYGRSELELQEFSQAAHELDSAITFCKTARFDEPHYYSGISYFRLGEKEKAIARMEEVIKLYPEGQYAARAKVMINEMTK